MLKHRVSYSKWSSYVTKFSIAHASEPLGAEELSFIILRTAKKSNLTRHVDPTGIASAACYIASILVDKKIPMKRIAEIAKVAPKTIKNRYKYLTDNLLFTIEL